MLATAEMGWLMVDEKIRNTSSGSITNCFSKYSEYPLLETSPSSIEQQPKLEIQINPEFSTMMRKLFSSLGHKPFRKAFEQSPSALRYKLGISKENDPSGYKLMVSLYEDRYFMEHVRFKDEITIEKYLLEHHEQLLTYVVRNSLTVSKKAVSSTKNVAHTKNFVATKNYHSTENVNIVHKVVSVAHYAVTVVAGVGKA